MTDDMHHVTGHVGMTDESVASLAGLTQHLWCSTGQHLWKLSSCPVYSLLNPLMSPKDSKRTLSKHNWFADKSAAALRQTQQRTTVTQHMYASKQWHADHEDVDSQRCR